MNETINGGIRVCDEFGFVKKPVRASFLWHVGYGEGDTAEEAMMDLLESIRESARSVEDYLEATYSKPRVDVQKP